VRLLFALATSQPTLARASDEFYYRGQAELLIHGHWWVAPGSVVNGYPGVPAASHPPLFSGVLALADLVGLHGMDAQRAFLCVISVTAVVFCGRIGARLAGSNGEVAAAWAAALLPGMWIYDGTVLSETVTVPLVAATVLVLYRLRERPTAQRAAVLGLTVALCALTRPELIVLVVIFAPLWLVRGPWKTRMGLTAVFIATVVVLVGPWVGRNLHDFTDTEFISANFGSVVVGANCATTYSGPLLGTWDPRCVNDHVPPAGDASVLDHYFLSTGEQYARQHASRVPVVVVARIGRTIGVWPAPAAAAAWDARAGGTWPRWAGWLYWATWLLSIPFVVTAVVALRRSRIVAWPLYALIGLFVVVSAVMYDDPRFASSCQAALAVLVGIGCTRIASTVTDRRLRVGA